MRRAVVPLIVALLALSLTACAALPRQVPDDDVLGEADRTAWMHAARALDRGRADEALEHLGGPLAVEPWHIPSHVLRQDALARLGRADEVAALYAAGLAEAETDAARILLAHRALPFEDPRRLAGYRRAVELDPESPWPHLAVCYQSLRTAANWLAQAAQHKGAGLSVDAEKARGVARGALDVGEKSARAAVERAPRLARSHAALADALLADPATERRPLRVGEARESAHRATELDPGNPRWRVVLARAQRATKDDEAAVESLELALELTDGAPDVSAYLGRVLLDLRRDEDARTHLENAATVEHPDVSLLLNLGVAHFRLEEFVGAVDAFERARVLAPGDPRPLEGLALTRARLTGRSVEEKALRDYLELGGENREETQPERSPPRPPLPRRAEVVK